MSIVKHLQHVTKVMVTRLLATQLCQCPSGKRSGCTNVSCMHCRLQTAIQNVALDQVAGTSAFAESGKASHPSAKHLKPITQAMELVFGSAAAISAAFGLRVSNKSHAWSAISCCIVCSCTAA